MVEIGALNGMSIEGWVWDGMVNEGLGSWGSS